MSVTRWINVSNIPSNLVNKKQNKKIFIIDTPGLDDNRSPQIDITNVLGTLETLKKLKKAWIVIVISDKQFGDRWFSCLKELIKQISKYLLKIDEFKNSISFVLTKGLTI